MGKNGLTEAVATETARALHDHELIKVKAPGGDREARDALFASSRRADRQRARAAHRQCRGAVPAASELPRILIPDPEGAAPRYSTRTATIS